MWCAATIGSVSVSRAIHTAAHFRVNQQYSSRESRLISLSNQHHASASGLSEQLMNATWLVGRVERMSNAIFVLRHSHISVVQYTTRRAQQNSINEAISDRIARADGQQRSAVGGNPPRAEFRLQIHPLGDQRHFCIVGPPFRSTVVGVFSWRGYGFRFSVKQE